MNIIEERVLINSEYKIGATISRPDDKKRPLVLVILGTGKLDRDGNMKGFKTDLYKNMSDMFVNMGYVCIRYDKRGTHESTGSFKSTGLSDLVNDSAKVIEYAKTLPYVDNNRIIACGHSEGSMIATLLTKQTKLERIILLGGACMCLKSAMEYQNFKMLDEFKNKKGLLAWFLNKTMSKEKVEKQLSALYEKAKKSKKDTFFFRGAFLPAKWMRAPQKSSFSSVFAFSYSIGSSGLGVSLPGLAVQAAIPTRNSSNKRMEMIFFMLRSPFFNKMIIKSVFAFIYNTRRRRKWLQKKTIP